MIVGDANTGFMADGGVFKTVNAVDFNGTTDFLNKATDLTGDADSSKGILSFWVRIDGSPSFAFILSNESQYVGVQHSSVKKFNISLYEVGGGKRLIFETTTAYTNQGVWYHVLATWDTNFAAGAKISHLYVTNVSDKTVVEDIYPAFSVDYTRSMWNVASRDAGDAPLNGCLAEIYFAPGQYLDFSEDANRRKFITGGNKPVDLGVNGSIPTGVAPLLYLPNPFGTVGTNAGTGGNFTINGSPTAASSTPSD